MPPALRIWPDQRPRIGHQQAQVLGRVRVRQLDRLVQVGGEHDAAPVGQRRGGDLRPAQRLQLAPQLDGHRLGQRARRGEQDRRGQHVVLGLRQQVGRGPGRVGRVVGDHHRLGRPVEPVDAHRADHLPLGQRDEQPARADDLVHRGHGLGAVGHARRSPARRRAQTAGRPSRRSAAARIRSWILPCSVRAACRR